MIDFNEDITFYAFRYALGRKTYAVKDVTDYLIDKWHRLSKKTRMLIIEEIEKAIEERKAGMDCDIQRWKAILLLEEATNEDANPSQEVSKKCYLFKSLGLILPKDEVDKATKEVNELRKKIDNGEIDLTEYEKMADNFSKKKSKSKIEGEE